MLTIGLAVSRSGLAERVARFFLRRSRGSARSLYLQLLLAFPLLTIILPSATTRTGILVHVYEQALELAQVPRRAPLASAIMMALNSINRLASTILLTGGITPMVAAALIGGVYWSQWLLLMSVPYLALLTIGSLLIYFLYRRGFDVKLPPLRGRATRSRCRAGRCARSRSPSAPRRCGSPIRSTTGTRSCRRCSRGSCSSCRASACSPGASSSATSAGPISSCSRRRCRSPARSSRAARAHGSRSSSSRPCRSFAASPSSSSAILMVASVPVRLLIPNITGFLATTIPIAMSIGTAAGVNPLICGLAVMIAGDAVLYYPAQSASSLAVYERGYLSAPEIFRFGVWMTLDRVRRGADDRAAVLERVGEPLAIEAAQIMRPR